MLQPLVSVMKIGTQVSCHSTAPPPPPPLSPPPSLSITPAEAAAAAASAAASSAAGRAGGRAGGRSGGRCPGPHLTRARGGGGGEERRWGRGRCGRGAGARPACFPLRVQGRGNFWKAAGPPRWARSRRAPNRRSRSAARGRRGRAGWRGRAGRGPGGCEAGRWRRGPRPRGATRASVGLPAGVRGR